MSFAAIYRVEDLGAEIWRTTKVSAPSDRNFSPIRPFFRIVTRPALPHHPATRSYPDGTGLPAASAAFNTRACVHIPRYSKPQQLHVTSPSSATTMS